LESETELDSSELLYLGLGYGALIQKMHHSVISQKIPQAVLISGPKGVGKRTLCRVIAAQVLDIHPWLSDIVGIFMQTSPQPIHGEYAVSEDTAMGSELGHFPNAGLTLNSEKLHAVKPLVQDIFAPYFHEKDENSIPWKQSDCNSNTVHADVSQECPSQSHMSGSDTSLALGTGPTLNFGVSSNLHPSDPGAPHSQWTLSDYSLKIGKDGKSQKVPLDNVVDPSLDLLLNGPNNPLLGPFDSANPEKDLAHKSPNQWIQNSKNSRKGRPVYARWKKDKELLDGHPEYIVVQPGSGIEDIRRLRQRLSYTRHTHSWRVVLLPEVQSFSASSTNALLKWIESPSPKTFFLLTASGALPKTLSSRCISYTMPPLNQKNFSIVRSGGKGAKPSQGCSFPYMGPDHGPIGKAVSRDEWNLTQEVFKKIQSAGHTGSLEHTGTLGMTAISENTRTSGKTHGCRGDKVGANLMEEKNITENKTPSPTAPHLSHSNKEISPSSEKERYENYLFFKVSQGCLGRGQYWKDHMNWVEQGWALLHRCALGHCVIEESWLKTALTMDEHVWEMMYIWAREVYGWAYAQGFLWHWDAFWESTWALVGDHRTYHTDFSGLLQTICARIHGFFNHYGLPPMPQNWGISPESLPQSAGPETLSDPSLDHL
jgi:DNA polymerase III delta prime subunit